MTDPTTPPSIDNFGDLPIQPTGSGVADLEIAYEQMRIAEGADGTLAADATVPAMRGDDEAEIAAHPS